MRCAWMFIISALLGGTVLAHGGVVHKKEVSTAAPIMDFVPPAPGTYALQRIMQAPDGTVLDTNSKPRALSTFMRDKITLLGFVYTTCVDPTGCPLAYEVFNTLKAQIKSAPELQQRVQLVSLSFDPLRDSPEVMKHYAGSHLGHDKSVPWYFLTTKSPRELLPLVSGFGQDVRVSVNEKDGRVVRELSHVLKVFLIDKTGTVREIYSSSFLMPMMVLNDIKTLIMEEREMRSAEQTQK